MLGAAIGAAAGFLGQRSANKTNVAEAAKNRSFQAQQAKQQMAFQERMRNTSWQAAVADMEAAGINPALAYSQGPAGLPGGASGSGSQAQVQDEISSAMQGARMAKELDLLENQVKKTGAEARQADAEARVAGQRSNYLLREYSVNGRRSPPPLNLMLEAEVDSAAAGATNMRALARRNAHLADIAGPLAGLSNRFGEFLPIGAGLMAPGGLGSAGIRALSRNFLRRKRR